MGRFKNTKERMLTNTQLNGECLEWQKSKDKDGYGISSISGIKMPAHRAFWILSGKEIPESAYLLHKCNNRACINPDHLYIGSQKQNVQDQINAGTFVFGELNGQAKLTADQVRLARSSNLSCKELANIFNVSYYTMWDLLKGRSWKHLN